MLVPIIPVDIIYSHRPTHLVNSRVFAKRYSWEEDYGGP